MDAAKEEIDRGADICQKIKQLYFNDTEWIDCHTKVAILFNKIKEKARIYYPDNDDPSRFRSLQHWSESDIKEAIDG